MKNNFLPSISHRNTSEGSSGCELVPMLRHTPNILAINAVNEGQVGIVRTHRKSVQHKSITSRRQVDLTYADSHRTNQLTIPSVYGADANEKPHKRSRSKKQLILNSARETPQCDAKRSRKRNHGTALGSHQNSKRDFGSSLSLEKS